VAYNFKFTAMDLHYLFPKSFWKKHNWYLFN
jgi:hypothetical protein